MDVLEEYNRWCSDPIFDAATQAELKAISDEKEIADRFYKNLSFGTGGLRGVIGAGTNRMNIYKYIHRRQGDAGTCGFHQFRDKERLGRDRVRQPQNVSRVRHARGVHSCGERDQGVSL